MAKILYIESHPEIRDTLAQLLELNRYEVAVAGDGLEGIEKARTWLPDLILTNLRLPRMDGFAAIKALRSEEGTAHIPIIVLSAWSSAKHQERALAVGANEHLTQPAELPKLLNTIDHYLQSWIYDRDYKSLKGADLRALSLHGVDLSGADLTEANLSQAVLIDAKLSQANLNRTNLEGTNLQGADLSEADLRQANLSQANLSGANLSHADLRGADLRQANLGQIDPSQADLDKARRDDKARFKETWRRIWKIVKRKTAESDMSGADQREADLRTSGKKPTVFHEASYDSQTLWPEEFDPEQAGAKLVK